MSGPYSVSTPPAILIAYSGSDGGWRATAVIAEDDIDLEGPTTSIGRHPSDALQTLLEKRFCALRDEDCPATLISIEVHDG